jgi:hypothetical protein
MEYSMEYGIWSMHGYTRYEVWSWILETASCVYFTNKVEIHHCPDNIVTVQCMYSPDCPSDICIHTLTPEPQPYCNSNP